MTQEKFTGVLRSSDNPYINYPCIGEILDFEVGNGVVISAVFRPQGATPVLIRCFDFVTEEGENPFAAYKMPENRKVLHLHEEQFDAGVFHPACGRGGPEIQAPGFVGRGRILPEKFFEAADPKLRCKLCEKIWFPTGQPDWHRQAALKEIRIPF